MIDLYSFQSLNFCHLYFYINKINNIYILVYNHN